MVSPKQDPLPLILSVLGSAYALGQRDWKENKANLWPTHKAPAERHVLTIFEYSTDENGRCAFIARQI